MCAELRLGRVACLQRGDGNPAVRAHPRCLGGVAAERDEQPAALGLDQPGGEDRIEIERKANRGLLAAVLVDDGVATAAADLAACALGEQREAEPGLIFEAVALAGLTLWCWSGAYGFNVVARNGGSYWVDMTPDDPRLSPAMRLALTVPAPEAVPGRLVWHQGAPGFEVATLAVMVGGRQVDAERELMHTFGDARRFLRAAEGVVRYDVTDMCDSALRTPMAAGIDALADVLDAREHHIRERVDVVFSRIELASFPLPGLNVELSIRPLILETEAVYASGLRAGDGDLSTSRIVELEIEIQRTREALQSTIEEIETANEELQATNEQLMSSNEE
eukprot:gene31449-41935_t